LEFRRVLFRSTGLHPIIPRRLTFRPPMVLRIQRHHTAFKRGVVQQTGKGDIKNKTVIDLEVLLGAFGSHALADTGGGNDKPEIWGTHRRLCTRYGEYHGPSFREFRRPWMAGEKRTGKCL